jgi:hypothetical protein
MAGKSKPAISETKPRTIISSTRLNPHGHFLAILLDLPWHPLRTDASQWSSETRFQAVWGTFPKNCAGRPYVRRLSLV